MVTAGLVVTVSGAQGLVVMLVVLAACGVANRSGPGPGVVLAAAAGLMVIVVSVFARGSDRDRAGSDHGGCAAVWMTLGWAGPGPRGMTEPDRHGRRKDNRWTAETRCRANPASCSACNYSGITYDARTKMRYSPVLSTTKRSPTPNVSFTGSPVIVMTK